MLILISELIKHSTLQESTTSNSLCVCPSINVTVCYTVSLSICLFVFRSTIVSLFICLSVHLQSSKFDHLSICMSTFLTDLPVCSYVCLSFKVLICSSNCLYMLALLTINLSVCLFV
jgi:hypothetical protein